MKYPAIALIVLLFASLVFWIVEKEQTGAIREMEEIERLSAPIDALISAAKTPEDCSNVAFQAAKTSLPYLPSIEEILLNRDSEYEKFEYPPEMVHMLKEGIKGAYIYGLCMGRLQTEGKITAE